MMSSTPFYPRSATWSASLLAVLFCSACTGADGRETGESADTGPTCPSSKEEFCLTQLGGACPTLDEALTLTCDGYRFDPSGSGTPVESGEEPDCSSTVVYCQDSPYDTTLWFMDGALYLVTVDWPASEMCPGHFIWGEPLC